MNHRQFITTVADQIIAYVETAKDSNDWNEDTVYGGNVQRCHATTGRVEQYIHRTTARERFVRDSDQAIADHLPGDVGFSLYWEEGRLMVDVYCTGEPVAEEPSKADHWKQEAHEWKDAAEAESRLRRDAEEALEATRKAAAQLAEDLAFFMDGDESDHPVNEAVRFLRSFAGDVKPEPTLRGSVKTMAKLARKGAQKRLKEAIEAKGWFFGVDRPGYGLTATAFHVTPDGRFVPGLLMIDPAGIVATVFIWDDESAEPFDGVNNDALYTVERYGADDEDSRAACVDVDEVIAEIEHLMKNFHRR